MRSQADWVRVALLLLAATIPYLNALSTGFTFDDRGVILENPLMHQETVPVVGLLTQPYFPGALYRPVTFFTYWLNRHFHGVTPFGFHAVNLVLHLVATWLVYQLASTTRLGTTVAFVAALLFAVHPIHTEAVTSIVGRAELLSTICVLGALLCAERTRPGAQRSAWLAGACVAFALGLLSKESAFVFLPLLVIVTALRERRAIRGVLVDLNSSGELPLFASIGAAYLGLRWALFGTLTVGAHIAYLDNPMAHAEAPVRIGTALVVLSDALAQVVVPVRLSADYSFNQIPLVESLGDPRLAGAVFLLGVLTILVWSVRKSMPLVLGGVLFFLAAFSLTANILFPIGTIRGERLLYLPSVGLCLIAAAVVAAGARQRPRLTFAALGLVVLAYAGRTWVRNPDWATEASLYRATVEVAPDSAKAHHNLGAALAQLHDYDDASVAFRRALQIYPDYDEAAFGIGTIYQGRGIMTAALRWYDEALRIEPAHAKAFLNRGVIFYNSGEVEAAENSFRAGLALNPNDYRLLTGIGFIHLAGGRWDEARHVFEEVQTMVPDYPETLRGLDLAAKNAQTAVLRGS